MYAQLVNNLDELGFTEVEPYLSEYLSKAAKEGIALQDALLEISDRELSLRQSDSDSSQRFSFSLYKNS